MLNRSNVNYKSQIIMKKLYILIIALASLFMSCQQTAEKANTEVDTELQTSTEKSIYDKAGIIEIHDPKAVMVGYRKPGDDVFEISLDDIGKYTGHICAGISSGFVLTAQALQSLYPNGEMPVRGQISIAASAYNDIAEVAAYVVRARMGEGDEKEDNVLLIDNSIEAPQKGVTLILKRNDTGKMVKAVFDKSKVMNPDAMKLMMPLKKKILSGKANDEEKKQFATNVQKFVKTVIEETPEGLITVSECNDYEFK
jgi:hypothetical protein